MSMVMPIVIAVSDEITSVFFHIDGFRRHLLTQLNVPSRENERGDARGDDHEDDRGDSPFDR
jgi:hypothetical protein